VCADGTSRRSGSARRTSPAFRSCRTSFVFTRQRPMPAASSGAPVSRRKGSAARRASTSEKVPACAGAASNRSSPTRVIILVMRAYIGLGSNLGEREHTLRAALERLSANPEVEIVAVSSFRETDPVGPIRDQPRFLNGAAALETTLEARALL